MGRTEASDEFVYSVMLWEGSKKFENEKFGVQILRGAARAG